MALTLELGEFVAGVAARGAPATAHAVAKTGFIDSIATMIAGRGEDAVRTAFGALAPLPDGPARLWFGATRTGAAEAALLNGMAAHALDFDDVSLRGHPSAVLVPAIVALAQQRDASGRAMLDAYVAGFEAWGELVDRESGIHHMKGWHPTGVFGAVGAAAACACLMGLDARQASHALGLAASQSAGLMSNFGSMAKPFHAGRAAQAGVLSARLAAAGFTASPDALEHPQGFLAAISPAGDVDRESPADTLGRQWRIEARGLNLKKYPTCYYTHRAIDALLALLARAPLDAAEVASVDVTMSREHATVLRNHRPADALAAKFSIEFAVASALVAGKVSMAQLDDGFVRSAPVQALFGRVHVSFASAYDPDTPGAAFADQVVVRMRDGAVHASEPVHHALGHARRPLPPAMLREKFLDCLQAGGAGEGGEALFDQLLSLERQSANGLQVLSGLAGPGTHHHTSTEHPCGS